MCVYVVQYGRLEGYSLEAPVGLTQSAMPFHAYTIEPRGYSPHEGSNTQFHTQN